MTCADALDQILSADLAALRGESDRSLRGHLDGCPACAADAVRIIDETGRLGAALVERERRPEIRRAAASRSVVVLVPIGIAAAIILIVAITDRTAGTSPPRVAVVDSPVAMKTPIPNGDTAIVSPSRVVPKQIASRVAAPAADPVANVFVDRPMADVSVTVGVNQRAAIIATSNPNITVVWLSRGQQP